MSKWADYCVSAVRFNSAHTHIDRVKALPDNGDNLGSAVEFTRQQVVTEIKNRVTFVTIFKGNDGKWQKGQPIYIFQSRAPNI